MNLHVLVCARRWAGHHRRSVKWETRQKIKKIKNKIKEIQGKLHGRRRISWCRRCWLDFDVGAGVWTLWPGVPRRSTCQKQRPSVAFSLSILFFIILSLSFYFLSVFFLLLLLRGVGRGSLLFCGVGVGAATPKRTPRRAPTSHLSLSLSLFFKNQ